MKYISLFIILFTLNSAFARDPLKGYNSSEDAVKAFVSPLKQGSKGVSASIESLKGLNGENFNSLNSDLSRFIKENGKVVSVRQIDSYSALGGNLQKGEYEIEFLNGKKRQFQMDLLRPAENAGYHIIKMQMID